MVIYTRNKLIIMLAWGPRRVSSKSDPGTLAYPECVGASHRLWMSWFKSGIRRWFTGPTYIVISESKSKHGQKYGDEVREQQEEEEKAQKKADIKARLDDLIAERQRLRAERRFKEADDIRDVIEAVGIKVSDTKL
jgi:hypothetical protein|tara:strand:+ start:1437 stop:1844 length:408 start_codon:yes stop_codon:yes gene_type:complete